MSQRYAIKRMILPLILLALAASLISCTLPTPGEEVALAEPAPRAWIDFPRDGARVPVGASVMVVSHAYAEDGVAEVLLSVNGTAYRRDPPTETGDTLVEIRQEWVPTAPGLHTLQVRTYDAAGVVSTSDQITIEVIGDAIEPTEVVPATAVPTLVPTEGPTEVPTEVPTDVPTVPPTIVPTEVPTSVPTEVPTQVPTEVPTEVPTALPTQVPTEVPDEDPPPVPTLNQPANGAVIDPCPFPSEVVLEWNPVSDPSDVFYYVKLESQGKVDEWHTVRGWGPTQDTQVVADIDCGIIYRWAVRAQDGAGNLSDWSVWGTFSITLE
jgi:hypothetical protein